jgi:hypothetical protein
MNNEEIQKYIADERARGVRDEDIKKELLVKGWKEEDVNAGITANRSADGVADSPVTGGTLLPAGTLVSVSFKELTDHFVLIAQIMVLPLICYVIAMLSQKMGSPSVYIAPILSIIGALLFLLAQAAVMKQMRAGWSLSVGASYDAAKPYFWTLLVASVFMGLAFLGGLLLLIIPGIIVAFWFTFLRQAIVLENLKVLDAMSYSRELMRNYWVPIFWRVLVLGILAFIISLASSIPYIGVLTSLISVPFATIYMVRLYDDMKRQKYVSIEQTKGKDRGLYIALAVLGVIAAVLFAALVFFASIFSAGMLEKMLNNSTAQLDMSNIDTFAGTSMPATPETTGVESRDHIRISHLGHIQLGLELYYDAHGQYPDALSRLVDEKFIQSPMPVDPLDNTPYVYHFFMRDGGLAYTLGASLENGENTVLLSDADTTNMSIQSSDVLGCSGEVGRHCYDLAP